MMFDFEKWSKKQTDKIFLYFDIEKDPIYTKRFKRFIRWLGYKFNPALLSVVSFMLLIWIFNKIYVTAGMDKLMVVFMVIVIFSLRGISAELKKLTE